VRRLSFLLILLVLPFCASASTDLELVQLHRSYTDAISIEDDQSKTTALGKVRQAYQRLLLGTLNPPSALHYNLGTLHLQLEEYGPAILQLKLAHLKNPNDPRVVDHLRRASRQAGVPISDEQQNLIGGWAQDTWEAIPVVGLQSLLLLFALIGTLLIFRASPQRKIQRWGVSSLILILLLGVTLLRESDWGVSREVVLMKEFNPRSGVGSAYPGILGEGRFKSGHSGTVLREQGGWVEVHWYDSGIGWVPADLTSEVSN
jgi:hypothetical protein